MIEYRTRYGLGGERMIEYQTRYGLGGEEND